MAQTRRASIPAELASTRCAEQWDAGDESPWLKGNISRRGENRVIEFPPFCRQRP